MDDGWMYSLSYNYTSRRWREVTVPELLTKRNVYIVENFKEIKTKEWAVL